jgi:alkylhydroperoxidase family enzyme
LSDAQMEALAGDGWRGGALFSDRERAVIAWAEAVTRLSAEYDDDAFRAMREHFTVPQIVELTFIVSMWNLSNRFARALQLQLEPPGRRIEFQEP